MFSGPWSDFLQILENKINKRKNELKKKVKTQPPRQAYNPSQ